MAISTFGKLSFVSARTGGGRGAFLEILCGRILWTALRYVTCD